MRETINYFILFLIYAIRLASVDGAAFIVPAQPKPEEFANQEGCYMTEIHTVLPYEKPYSPQDGKTCMQYTCNRDNTTSVYTCGAMFVPENCTRVSGDRTLPYPQCCDGISCPKQPVLEDPNLEEISHPEANDDSDDTDPSVDPPRPCSTCPCSPGKPVPDSEEPDPSPSVSLKLQEPVIPSNAPRAPSCANFVNLSSDLRDIPSYCQPTDNLISEADVVPADELANKAKDKSLDTPEDISVVEPVLERSPAVPDEPEPELHPNDPLPILEPPKYPPTDPVCAYPTDLSLDDMHATSAKRPPYCPPVRDEPLPPIPPKRPSKPSICYYPTSSSDSSADSIIYPPREISPLADAKAESESSNPHLPIRILPVEPPVES